MRKPCVFARVGIPGSGGPDWLRNDWEPVVCVTRGKLPWSDNTACGKPPRWAPGGEMSNRLTDGQRVNQWGKCGTEAGVNGVAQRTRTGKRQRASRPSHVMTTRKETPKWLKEGMHTGVQNVERVPAIANPGNVIRCNVGGGQMGHTLAHENEAPFPLRLAEFFVRSFCPPGGVVADCFSGSGTVCHVAVQHGRRFIGCDLRQSQVDVCARRMATVTPELFSGVV